MEAFIERYTEWVHSSLGDPSNTRRSNVVGLVRDLEAHQTSVYERLLKTSSGESTLGYTETDIILKKDQEFYQLPGNFRQFIGFERRQDGDPNFVLDRLGTVAEWQRDRGIVISSPERGFRIRPVSTINSTQTWTLAYQIRPIHSHWGMITDPRSVKPNILKLPDEIPQAQGELVLWNDYYKGSLIHVIEAVQGAGQSIEVTSFNPTTHECALRHNFATTPKVPIKYEFRTFLPPGYDKIFALSVALANTPERVDSGRRRMLLSEWKEMFETAKSYFRTTTRDRAPLPNLSESEGTLDPFAF